MKFNHVKHDADCKLWCSLAALSCITGQGTAYCKEKLREIMDNRMHGTGERKNIVGVYATDYLAALHVMGYITQSIFKETKQKEWSVARALHAYQPTQKDLFAIRIPDHVLVTNGKYVIDSFYPTGIALWEYHYIDARCKEIIIIKEMDLS